MNPQIEVDWPAEETWFDFEGDLGLLAGDSFLRRWEGMNSEDYVAITHSAISDWCQTIHIADTYALLTGDVPGLLLPSTVRWCASELHDQPVLAIWKWIGASEGFKPPSKWLLGSPELSETKWSGKLPTKEEAFHLSGSGSPGTVTMSRNDLPQFRFRSGVSNVDVRVVSVAIDRKTAEFLLHLVWGSFVGYTPPTLPEIPPPEAV